MPYERILAHHLVLSSYGFWLANDPRGSGSHEMRDSKFEDLGPIHPGRKRKQPTRTELRAFYLEAEPLLNHEPLWFREAARDVIGKSFADVIQRRGYTVWACFVGTNHAHLCIRYHRDKYEEMFAHLTAQSRTSLCANNLVSDAHPVWANRPYSVFLHSPDDIRRVITYIEKNAVKEGLSDQQWDFVRPYDGWPMNKR